MNADGTQMNTDAAGWNAGAVCSSQARRAGIQQSAQGAGRRHAGYSYTARVARYQTPAQHCVSSGWCSRGRTFDAAPATDETVVGNDNPRCRATRSPTVRGCRAKAFPWRFSRKPTAGCVRGNDGAAAACSDSTLRSEASVFICVPSAFICVPLFEPSSHTRSAEGRTRKTPGIHGRVMLKMPLKVRTAQIARPEPGACDPAFAIAQTSGGDHAPPGTSDLSDYSTSSASFCR